MRKMFVMAVGLLFLFSLTAAAKSKQTSLKLFSNGTVNGTELKAGEYTVETGENEVVFYKGKKEVARSPYQAETAEQKHASNMVIYEGAAIIEIRLAGTKTNLKLPASATAGEPVGKGGKSSLN